MALIKKIRGYTPKIGRDCYLAENSSVIGDVEIGNSCSVWFNTVIRGDVNSIRIGDNVNIQDGCVLHCLFEKSIIEIGNNVTIGHNAIIHGAKIEDNVLIGMGAIIMDHAIIKKNSIIAAGSLVLKGTVVEPGNVYAGSPAKLMKKLKPEEINRITQNAASNYLKYADWYK